MPTPPNKPWPSLPLNEWQDTYKALHLWTQIIGKIKLKLTPKMNHWWNSSFQLTPDGLTTGLIHCDAGCFQVDFDFSRHKLFIRMESGEVASLELKTRSVADFYTEVMEKLNRLGVEVKIWTQPVEMEYKVHFEDDTILRQYNSEYVERFLKILLETDRVAREFRSCYYGKTSPVHFFWGSFDMALTFFSGRMAPKHPGAPNVGKEVMEEAYNRELCSFGFWPGEGLGEPAYYAYAYPEPEGYSNREIAPAAAYYHTDIKEYILPYEALRTSENPGEGLLAFIRSTFEAAYYQGKWDEALYEKTTV